MTVPILIISLFTRYFHPVIKRDINFFIRLIYFGLAIIVDIISSSIKNKYFYLIYILSWGLTILTLFPFPLYKMQGNNILSKIFLYIIPFYILFIRSYEGLFLIIFYNYLQLWIKMKWHEKEEKQNYNKIEGVKNNNFNLIDIFMYMFLVYSSFFSTENIVSISEFNISSVIRFVSELWPKTKIILILIKTLIPNIFITTALFEICRQYNYSTFDSLIMITAMCEIINIKFFFRIKDSGSWFQIGMSIAFFIISNAIVFIQFFIFFLVKCISWIDIKINISSYMKI